MPQPYKSHEKGSLLACRVVESGLSEHQVNVLIAEKLEDYDKTIRPQINGTLEVQLSMFVLSISNIEQEDMKYGLKVFMRQVWTDPRLAYGDDNGTTAMAFPIALDESLFLGYK